VAYLAVRFDAEATAAEAWSDALVEAGALSVEISDAGAGTAAEKPLFGEPGLPIAEGWPIGRVTALFPEDADIRAAMAGAEALVGLALPSHETYSIAEEDWVRATQAQFAPVKVTDRLWIVPSWCEAPDAQAINLTLDPGLAFGTGTHPTTRLCLEWLATELEAGASVLDYGSGSGILAIAAAMLGADRVVGTDVDPQAIDAARANAAHNRVAATFVLPDALPAGAFDVVVANILANPLRLLAPALAARVRAGGRVVLSGVLASQASDVAAAYAPWFIIHVWKSGDDGWVALSGCRRANPLAA
jgi:ribosomal protein L11 methyltransferase